MASFMLTCESGFVVAGMQEGEDYITPIRILSNLIAVTVTSSWISWRKVKRLSLFFAHWLSGLVLGLGYVVEDIMVSVCWTGSHLQGFIKAIKFIELAASNMLAITNLAICVNLALIIMSHRTVSRVKSVSSPPLIFLFLVISMAIAAASVPFWEVVLVLGTGFWVTSTDEGDNDFISVSMFYVEFVVGICMFVIVAWLLLFRMKEIKECWKLHHRIRFYFGLTLVGTAVNLGLGICGTINVLIEEPDALLLIWSWIFRYIHIALDTIVLYGVLRERNIDERADGARTGSGGLSSGQPLSRRAMRRGSGGSDNTSKPVASAPLI